jgi:ribosome maturation factor RimP
MGLGPLSDDKKYQRLQGEKIFLKMSLAMQGKNAAFCGSLIKNITTCPKTGRKYQAP